MKTFIYLPLIALIILTGCKSNKFTTQRYTNYGHASQKKSTNERVVAQKTIPAEKIQPTAPTEIVEAKVEKTPVTPVTLIASGFSTLRETFLKPDRKVYDLNSNTAESVTAEETVYADDSKTTVRSQKAVKEKVKREGFIGSAFATALWIILVVIFIVLIIFVLSAVF
jgi:PBP1b-binding outer membrane lipoprotein LpoB